MAQRILYTVPALTMGGVASVLGALARGVAGAGREVHVAYYEEAEPEFSKALSAHAGLHYVGTSCALPVLRPALIARKLRGLVGSLAPALVHAHSFDADLLSARALAGSKPPLLVSCHTFSYVRTARTHCAAYAKHAPNISSFIPVSGALALGLKTVPELAARPMQVIWNSADARFFEPVSAQERAALRARLGVSEGELLIGYVANFHPGKRHALLAEAFCRLAAKNVRLAFMGRELNAEAAAQTRGVLRENGALERCIFSGGASDALPFLRACDIYAHPSSSEAFSVALAEAAACGLPLAAMRVGGNPEIALEGRNAILCDADDAAGFAAGLEKLVTDGELRRAMGIASREIAAERVHPDRQLSAHLDLYERVITGELQ